MQDATITIKVLDCNSLHVGQLTLLTNSSEVSLKYNLTLFISYFTILFLFNSTFPSHGWRDSNSQPMVLETTTLPIELHPYSNLKSSQSTSSNYLIISTTLPAPTVLPPSRIAKRNPFSIATG